MVLGQALVAGSVVQGAKLRVWVKPSLARVWSRERNYGLGLSAGGGKCGPGSQTAGLGQAQPRPSVVRGEKLWSLGQALMAGSMVQGEKLRVWVKRCPARVWSRERNYGLGSSAGGGKYGPGSQTAAPGHPQPRRSMVQGAKPCPRVKPGPARVWSREQNRAPGSSQTPPKYGPGSKTVPPGHPLPRRSMVWGAKPCPRVTPAPPEHGPRI